MTTVAQVELGVRTGYATDTTCKIVVASLADGDVTISGTWGTTTITAANMVAIGSPVAGYVGSATITGLSSFTRYNYTATQGTKTATGSFMTAPAASDDFSIFFASCDCNTTYSDQVTGFWGHVKDYAQNGALPTVGVLFVDDHGYVDYNKADDTAGTGLVVSDLTVGASYNADVRDYAIAYMCNLGMLQDTTNDYIAWGRDDSRVWCNQNLNYLPQWGDHEFANDFGWDFNSGTLTTISGYNATGAQIWAAGKAAWDVFMLPLAPSALSGSYAWAAAYGCVNLITLDSLTNSDAAWNRTDAPGVGTGAITTLFGTTQIDAVLSFIDSSTQPFNLFGLANSIRYLSGTISVTEAGAQHPLYDHVLSEYQRLFTASGNTPKSLMDQVKSSGVGGVTVLLHGDYHHACVQHHKKAAYTGNLAENFYSIHLGTINGSSNFTMPLAEGLSFGGTTLEYSSGWTNGQHNYAGLRVDVYGSRSRPELHVTLFDSTGTAMWAGKWLARSSNEALDISYKIPSIIGTSSKTIL